MTKISNHLTGKLSELDIKIVHSVPEGGNWKNIPIHIPSKRLENIRLSFSQGKGSRSTYYGRLRREMPSYTINTYFNRPGNGCHIHYEQNRVLSQREAARLQSFPDSFHFLGGQGSVNKQIGNAVPPLLSYQIAKSLGTPGFFVDLFCGAGGMGLGFKWAGWTPIVANDIEKSFASTYHQNVDENVVVGSITDPAIMKEIVSIIENFKKKNKRAKIWVLGGPPCQGFSTAGENRSMEDPRNQLFRDYIKLLKKIRPNGFVFENVTGLLNMDGGKVFTKVKGAFKAVMPTLTNWVLNSVDYGIPQRRERVILIGSKDKEFSINIPGKITGLQGKSVALRGVNPVPSVEEALSDLPPIQPGEDGTLLKYVSPPQNDYQKLMRGKCSVENYIFSLKKVKNIR